jgi:hypothetical protein
MNAPEKLPAAGVDSETGEIHTSEVDADFDRLLRKQPSARDMIMGDATFARMLRVAELMASGRAAVPKHLQGSVADCMAIVMQAMRWDMDPYAVAQKTHIVNGALGYEAQLVNAVVENSGAIVGHFHYQHRGEGGTLETRVGAVLRGDAEITWGEWLSVNAPKVKNSPLWQTNPKQQLGYLQVKNWARSYCPGAILGVYTADEIEDRIGDDTPPVERGPRRKSTPPASAPAPAASPAAASAPAPAAPASNQVEKPEAAAASPTPAGSISGGQVAYLRNKLAAATVSEQTICDRFQVAGIEHLSAEQFDKLKAELLAAS